jgi:hypothetical protein
MLERLTATAFDKQREPAKEVFDACCTELETSYQAAVFREANSTQGNTTAELAGDQSLAEDLKEFAYEYNRSGKCSVADCGKIARYIILAWTYYVGLVVWDESGAEEEERAKKFLECPGDGSHQSHHAKRIYNPERIGNLPRSSILY